MKQAITLMISAALVLLVSGFASAKCPQPRKTMSAPVNIAGTAIPADADAAKGEKIYQEQGTPMACKKCHGDAGGGDGKFGRMLDPKPRNFTCKETMRDISPGQMFWIIKEGSNLGSEETGMVAHKGTLTDNDIWSVVKYIRTGLMK